MIDATVAAVTFVLATIRIVSLSPATTEDLLEIGAGPHVVGIDRYATRPPQVKNFPRLGGIYDASPELVLAKRPSVVVFQEPNTPEMEALRRTDLRVIGMPDNSLDDDWRTIEELGRLSGREAQARALVARLRDHIERRAGVLARQRRLRVLVVEGEAPIFSVAKGSFYDDFLKLANLQNVAEDAGRPWPVLSPEFVAKADPDVIILADSGFITPSRAPWSLMSAVRNRRVVRVMQTPEIGPYVDQLFDQIVRAVAPFR